jgi:ABC-2 type transport system ATP-binding protein
MTPSVEAVGLNKRYGSFVALESLSFSLQAGEVLGVLGPNGAGKTTEIRRLVGVLPESAGYPARQTGEEYLRYFARLYGHSRASARGLAQELLAQVRLLDRRHSLIGGYSRGMRQRLGIARALVNDPQVVFLDEPTLGLDPAGQRQVLGLVRRITTERGATVLLSTHLLAEVEEVCSRVIILNRGRLAADGTVSEIARRAAAPRSARLRVAAEHVERARATLARSTGIERVEPANGQLGSLVAVLDAGGSPAAMNEGLRALADAEVPVLAFELEGARLSDAFLAMTEEA